MTLNAREIPGGGKHVEAVEAGAYPARVVLIAGLGLQPRRAYMGQERPPAQSIQVIYELLDEFMLDEDGNEIKDKPRWIWEDFPLFNMASDRATSTRRYYGLDPDMKSNWDWAGLINTPCIVTVTKDVSKKDPEKSYNNVSNVSPMRKKDVEKAPELVNKPLVFDPEKPDLEVFNALPISIQDKIKSALDFKGSPIEGVLNGGEFDIEEAPW